MQSEQPSQRMRLAGVARELNVHPATVTRWCRRGVVGANGQRYRLRSLRLGGRLAVMREDLDQFIAQLNAPAADTPTAIATDDAAVDAELDALLA